MMVDIRDQDYRNGVEPLPKVARPGVAPARRSEVVEDPPVVQAAALRVSFKGDQMTIAKGPVKIILEGHELDELARHLVDPVGRRV